MRWHSQGTRTICSSGGALHSHAGGTAYANTGVPLLWRAMCARRLRRCAAGAVATAVGPPMRLWAQTTVRAVVRARAQMVAVVVALLLLLLASDCGGADFRIVRVITAHRIG